MAETDPSPESPVTPARNANPLFSLAVDPASEADASATTPISPFKFAEPTASTSHLPREALLEHLGHLPPRLLLVCAPAGFGKTTFLRQYHQQCLAEGRDVLWCNLDATDNDLGRFLRVFGEHLGTLWQLSRAPASVDELLACVAGRERSFTLILDEFETIRSPALQELVQRLLDTLPAQGTLAIGSRSVPDLNLGRLRARGQVQEIGQEALRFSLEETRRYIRERCALALGDADIALLADRTEGWITALYLATLSLRWQDDTSAFIESFSGSNLELAEYLTEDLLLRQDEQTRRFLLETSVLESLCAPLCDSVTGRDDSQAQLDRLLQTNLFLLPLDNRQHWFRYHPLFASFLRDVLDQSQPGRAPELHARAALWYQREGRHEQALDQLFAAGEMEQAANLLAIHARTWMLAGHARLLLPWLERLQESTFDRLPELGLIYIWALIHARRLADAQRLIARPGLAGLAAIARVQWLALSDRMEEAYAVGLAQLDALSGEGDDPSYVQVAYYLSYCMICTGRFDEARAMLAQVPRQSGYLRNGADSLESLLDLCQGQLDSALSRLRATEQANILLGENTTTSMQSILALLLYERDELAEAETRLQSVLPQIKEMSTLDALISSHVLLARMADRRGERDTWMRHLAQLEQFGHQTGSRRTLCSAWLERARLATLEGRFDTARHALRSAEQLGDWDQPGVLFYGNEVDTPFIARQRLGIAQGDDQPVTALREALERARQSHRLRRALKLQLLLAMALDCSGAPRAALDELTGALRFASHLGFTRSFLDEGAPMGALLERWAVTLHGQEQALGILPGFVAGLQGRLASPAPVMDVEADDTQSGLTVRELQVVRLLALGYRNREIAEKMFLSELTVKSHLRRINAKLGAQGRTEAVAIARNRGLLD